MFLKLSKNVNGHRAFYREIIHYYKPQYRIINKFSDYLFSKIIFIDFDDEKIKSILILILRILFKSESIIFLIQPIYFKFIKKKIISNLFEKFSSIKVLDISNKTLVSDPILLYYYKKNFHKKKKKNFSGQIFHLDDSYKKRLDPKKYFKTNLLTMKSNTNFKDSKLINLVNKSQFVWCINKKKFTNLSSGIFWLAIILEKIPIICKSSYQEIICLRFKFPHILFSMKENRFDLIKVDGNWSKLKFAINECEIMIKNL